MTLVKRSVKGSPVSAAEYDAVVDQVETNKDSIEVLNGQFKDSQVTLSFANLAAATSYWNTQDGLSNTPTDGVLIYIEDVKEDYKWLASDANKAVATGRNFVETKTTFDKTDNVNNASMKAVFDGVKLEITDELKISNQFFKELPKQLELGFKIRAYNFKSLTSTRVEGLADITKEVINGLFELGNVSGTSIQITPAYTIPDVDVNNDIGRVYEVFCIAKNLSTNGFGLKINRAGTDYNLVYRGNGQLLEGITDSFGAGSTHRGSTTAYEFSDDDLISVKVYKKSATETILQTSKNGVYSDEIVITDAVIINGIAYAFRGNGVAKDPYFTSYVIDNSAELLATEKERTEIKLNAYEKYAILGQNALASINAKAFASTNKIHISKFGNDTTGDGTEFNPYLTYKKATEIATANAGASIIISDNFQYNFVRGAILPNGLNVIGFPSFENKDDARLAPLKSTSGLTWTVHSGNIWVTDYVLTNVPLASILNGATANSFHFGVWDENYNKLEWKVGGADIATNIANMTANSMVCHFNGSTAQDLRSDSANATTIIKLYVWLTDNANPNGLDLKATDYQTVASGSNDIKGSVSGLITGFNYNKDNFNFNVDSLGNAAKIGNLRAFECPSHGFVGLASVFGIYEYIGRGIEGATGYLSATGNVINRSSGGGMTIYTGTFYEDLVMQYNVLKISNAANAVYGHGSTSNKGYKAVHINYLQVINSNNCIKFDRVPTGGFPFVTAAVTVQFLDAQNVDGGFNGTGNLDVEQGFMISSNDDETITAPFFDFVQNNITTEPLIWNIKNFIFKNEKTYTAFSSAIRLVNTSAAASGIHTLILDNFIDESTEDKQLHLPRVAGLHPVHLILKNGTVLGDLQPKTVAVYPSQLTVEAGVTFGFGGRDFATLVTALDAAGVTHNLGTLTADDITLVKARTK